MMLAVVWRAILRISASSPGYFWNGTVRVKPPEDLEERVASGGGIDDGPKHSRNGVFLVRVFGPQRRADGGRAAATSGAHGAPFREYEGASSSLFISPNVCAQ